MNIDSILVEFVESYDRDAIDSIDALKDDYGRTYRKDTVNLVNVSESCTLFSSWVKGYSAYCIEEASKGNKPSSDVVMESFTNFMKTEPMLRNKPYLYPEIPSFVSGYINGVNQIISTINESKSAMMENDVDQSLIGAINEYTDKFTDALQEAFTPGMNTLLWASGYNTKKQLFDRKPAAKPRPTVFV